jgi:hypothetical protein
MVRLRVHVGVLVLFSVSAILAQQTGRAFPTSRSIYVQALVYLEDANLLTDLDVTAPTAKKLIAHRDVWYPKNAELMQGFFTNEQKWRPFVEEHQKALAALLTPEQMKRLSEIMLQKALAGPVNSGTHFANLVEVRDRLKLTTDQRNKLLEGKAPEQVLTADQFTDFKSMQGKPFTATLQATRPPIDPTTPPSRALANRMRPSGAVTEQNIQTELKLTEEQKVKIDLLVKNFVAGLRDLDIDQQKAAREAADADVLKILNAEQGKRLGEILIRRGVRILGLSVYLRSAAVRTQLTPTPEQEKQFAAVLPGTVATLKQDLPREETADKVAARIELIRKDQEQKLLAILTAEQRMKWRTALGEPFADDPTRPPGNGPNPGGNPNFGPPGQPGRLTDRTPAAVVYLAEPDVQKDLALTAEQLKSIQEQQTKLEATLKEIANLPARDRNTKRTAAEKEADTAVLALLKDAQKARLEELRLQHREQLGRIGAPIYRDPKITAALKLTDDDLARIDKVEADLHRIELLLEKEVPPLVGEPLGRLNDTASQIMGLVRTAFRSRELTAEQKTSWDRLIGKPYTGKFPAPRSGFGAAVG